MTSGSDSTTGDAASFRRKSYTPRTFVRGLFRIFRTTPALIRARRAGRISEEFVEKIMLATTAVNECPYCTRFHSNLAREADIDEDVIDALLEQDVEAAVDEYERTALLYAQRYAETDENPGEAAIAELEATYGPEMAADIRAFVRAIYFGNMLGNSYDALLYWVRNTITDCTERIRLFLTKPSSLFER